MASGGEVRPSYCSFLAIVVLCDSGCIATDFEEKLLYYMSKCCQISSLFMSVCGEYVVNNRIGNLT